MAVVITYELATDIVIENITVERKYADGVQTAYRLTANEGYVLHDTASDVPLLDENGNPTGEVYVEYYRQAFIAVRNDPSTWTWEAVLESTVPSDMIFGGGDNDHEIM